MKRKLNCCCVGWLLIGLLVFALTGCGGSSSGSSIDSDNSADLKEISITSVGSTTSIDESNEFNLSITGMGNTVTIKENNYINLLTISGTDNDVIIEEGVVVLEFYVTGVSNNIYIPIDSNISIEDTGVDNQVFEQ